MAEMTDPGFIQNYPLRQRMQMHPQAMALLSDLAGRIASGKVGDDAFIKRYMHEANQIGGAGYKMMVDRLGNAMQTQAAQQVASGAGPSPEHVHNALIAALKKATGGAFNPRATEMPPNPFSRLSGPNGIPNMVGP